MHPLRSRVGWGVPGRRRDVSTTKSPTGSPTLSWKTAVSTSGNTARRRAFRVGRGGGADRTQCRSIRAVRDPPRAIRADRTQLQGTSPVQDGRCGDDERTRRRGQSLLRNGGNSAPTEPNTEVFEPAATVDTAAPTEPNVEGKSRPGRLKCSRRPNPTRSSSPTRSRPRPNPPRVAKRCGPYTAVVLVERLRSAVAEATVVDLGFPVAALLLALGVLRGERRLLVLGDGASGIRTWFEGLGVCPKARIVCWSHLRKRCSEKMSAAGGPKDRRHAWERDLLGQLWQGEVDAAVDLPRVVLEWVKNPQAVEVLIASLEQRRASIPDSQQRLELVTGTSTGERQAKMVFATHLATRFCGVCGTRVQFVARPYIRPHPDLPDLSYDPIDREATRGVGRSVARRR